MTSATMTIRVSVDVKQDLEILSRETRRSRSFLAAEAIADYVKREKDIVGGILKGMEDVRAGRTTSHEDVVAQVQATIAKAAPRKAA